MTRITIEPLRADALDPDALDPDIDVALADQRAELGAHPVSLLAVIALGGVVGALVRAALTVGESDQLAAGVLPWRTLVINASGALLVGCLMAWLVRRTRHPLVRPFFGTGVLGGYTTFSAYAADAGDLLTHGHVATAVVLLVVTPALAVAAAWAGHATTGRLLGGTR